jgi:dethiobiotin synthetase
MNGLIVSGTDTDIGKTILAAGLVTMLNGRYWKPVQAGLADGGDSATVARLAPTAQIHTEAYRLNLPLSPHYAATLDNITIDPARLDLPPGDAPLVIEGAGGLLVPLTDKLLFADVFAQWKLPVVLAARTSLGTINHTLLSLEALRSRAIPIAGVAFIGDENSESERIICKIGAVRRLGRLPWLDPLNAHTLHTAMTNHFDLTGLL